MDFYLECGWDVDAVEQTTFRREELVGKRERYWKDVVEPLEEAASRVGDERSWQNVKERHNSDKEL